MGKSESGAGFFHAAIRGLAGLARCNGTRILGRATVIAAAFMAGHPAGAAGTVGAEAAVPVTLQVAPSGWGSTQTEELSLLLNAVAADFGAQFRNRPASTIHVTPGSVPMALFERGPEGAYMVELSARNARWHQFVYQFSHELCHIYSNFDNRDAGEAARSNQWFEESVCEAAALFNLRRLATQWTGAVPDPRWRDHAPAFARYAEYFMNEPHRRLPATHSLPAWFRENQAALSINPYFRDRNEVVANLLLPLFEREPRSWGAIAYLNHDRPAASESFTDFLLAWHAACPEDYRGVVREIMALFDIPATQTAEAPQSAH